MDHEVSKIIVFYGNNQRKKHANVACFVKSNSKEKRVEIKDTRKKNKSLDPLSDDDLCLALLEIIREELGHSLGHMSPGIQILPSFHPQTLPECSNGVNVGSRFPHFPTGLRVRRFKGGNDKKLGDTDTFSKYLGYVFQVGMS
jgi:hypothetical protein